MIFNHNRITTGRIAHKQIVRIALVAVLLLSATGIGAAEPLDGKGNDVLTESLDGKGNDVLTESMEAPTDGVAIGWGETFSDGEEFPSDTFSDGEEFLHDDGPFLSGDAGSDYSDGEEFPHDTYSEGNPEWTGWVGGVGLAG